MRAGWLVTTLVLGVVGCVGSDATTCGDVLCPPGAQCHASGNCILKDCGDGVATGAEECDPGTGTADLNDKSCNTEGFYRGNLACTPWCKLDLSDCNGFCGDAVVDPGEHCDGTPAVDETCTDYAFDVGRMSCTSACSPGFDSCSNVGWRVVGGDRLIPLNAIWGASATDIFAVGDLGRIWRGDGATWTSTDTNMPHLRGVWGSSASNVFAVGDNGTILRFDGTSWTKQTLPTSVAGLDFYGVWGSGPSDVYVVGEVTTILHYDGIAWSVERTASGGAPLRAVVGIGARVIAVGERPLLGARIFRKELNVSTPTWVLDTAPDVSNAAPTFLYDLLGIWTDGDEFFAVGGESMNGRNVVARYKDGVWTASTHGQFRLESVFGSSDTDIIAGGHTGVLMRYDGASWRPLFNDSNRTVSGLWGTSTRNVFGSTYDGTIIAPDGFEWSAVASTSGLSDLRGVERYDNGDLVVSGTGSFVAQIVDDVVQQMTFATTAPALMNGLWDTTDTLGAGTLYVGSNDSIWTRTGTGMQLSQILVPTPTSIASTEKRNIVDVWGANATSIYVVGNTAGNNGVPLIARFDGVSTWTDLTPSTIAADPSVRLSGVWGTSATDIFVVGNGGLILHSSDGSSFTQMSSGVTDIILRTVWGTGPKDVYATGDIGTVLHYDGTKWRKASLRSTEVFTTVIGTSSSNVFVSGTGGLWHFDGTSWSRQAIPVAFNSLDADVVGSTITFTGTEGEILEFQQTCTNPAPESQCNDAWDNDCDGKTNCADPDCNGQAGCVDGGACFVAATLGCNQSLPAATSYSGYARIDNLPCIDTPLTGSETAYRIEPTSSDVTVTLEGDLGNARMLMLEADAVSTACDVTWCSPATGNTITIPGDGKLHYVLVDAPAGEGAHYTLSTSCD